MDQKSGEQIPKFEIPPVVEGHEVQQEKARELQTDVDTVKKSKAKLPSVSPPITISPLAQNNTPTKAIITQDDSTDDTGMAASDVDLIEKHWIDRAKAIVEQTVEDPYRQQKEMTKEKADYIKKRFNKTIPTKD
jgi:hypothetical protein